MSTESSNNNLSNDQLLDDLQKLDEATDNMLESLETDKNSNQKSSTDNSAQQINAATIALEAAKISHAATENNQTATSAIIKLSHQQKQQTIEASQANVAWRNTVSKANKNIVSNKGTIAIMLGISIVFSLVAMAIVGYMYVSVTKKNELAKGEILEIISTELSLSAKKYELKIDQLSSLVEYLVTKENNTSLAITKQLRKNSSNHTPAEKTVVTVGNSKIKQEISRFNEQQNQKMHKIEDLLANINQQQIQFSKAQEATIKKLASTPVKVVEKGLTEAQLKKLNNLSWVISKQSKILKDLKNKFDKQLIQQNLISKNIKHNNQKNNLSEVAKLLKSLKQQLNRLEKEQITTQSRVRSLQQKVTKMDPKTRPYRYQSTN